ncbi:MAG: type II secretion system protein M [Alphaproteobacteria bacterium]|nr:type II secretion system protein M [Alphaproteobacteria bacterium]
MMTSLSPRSRRFTAVGLLALALLALYSFVVGPLLASYADNRRQTAEARATLAHYEEIGREIPALKKELDALHERGATAAGYLDGQNETLVAAALQERLKTAVVQTGGRLNSTQVLAGTTQGQTRRVVVRGQMQMNIAALQRVLYALESGSPYLFIDNLDVRPVMGPRGPDGADNDAALDVHFDVYGYMRSGT